MRISTRWVCGVGVLLLGLILVLPLLIGATTQDPLTGKCRTWKIDDVNDDIRIPVRGRRVCVSFEPDTASDGTGTEAEFSTCTDDIDATCECHPWDYDDDGARDGCVFTGTEYPLQQRYTCVVGVPYVQINTTAVIDTGQVSICIVE